MNIQEFEEALKIILQNEKTLLVATTPVCIYFEGETFQIESIQLKDGIILLSCAE